MYLEEQISKKFISFKKINVTFCFIFHILNFIGAGSSNIECYYVFYIIFLIKY